MRLVTVFVGVAFLVASSAGFVAAKGKDKPNQIGQKKSVVGAILKIRTKPRMVVVEPRSGSAQLQTQQAITQKKPKRMAFGIDDDTIIVNTGASQQKGAKGNPNKQGLRPQAELEVGQQVRVVYVIVKPTWHQNQGDQATAGQKPHQNQKIKARQGRKTKPGKKQKVKPGQDDGDTPGQFDDDDDEVGQQGDAKRIDGSKGTPNQHHKVKPGQKDKIKPGQKDRVKPGQKDRFKQKRRPRRRLQAIRIEILTPGTQQGNQDK